MATKAQSRLYGNHHAIQSTLLPLFESYSAKSSFVKLDAAMDSLLEFSTDLKTLQEQRVSDHENPSFIANQLCSRYFEVEFRS